VSDSRDFDYRELVITDLADELAAMTDIAVDRELKRRTAWELAALAITAVMRLTRQLELARIEIRRLESRAASKGVAA
jgi:hypothetical protein